MHQDRVTSLSTIKLLPAHLINQIKAGEVIERPSSLIKELVENAIDAKATQIDIKIINNGLDLITLEDNGVGMSFHDLPLAFTKHATSKISLFEDLYRLKSYGFRGEALSSMGSVARVECISFPSGQNEGGKFIIHGGHILSHTPYRMDHSGTLFIIKDLFYNTPVRLKFVRSKTSELHSILRTIHAFVISNPQIGFTLKVDDQDKLNYPPTSKDPLPRIEQLFGGKKNHSAPLLQSYAFYENINVRGFYSSHSTKGHTFKHHFLFVNKRTFLDKKIHQIILRALDGYWPNHEIGHYILFIDIPTDQIDVNVHPAKTSIKFFNENLVYSLIMESIKKSVHELKLETRSDLTSHDLSPKDYCATDLYQDYSQISPPPERILLSPHMEKRIFSLMANYYTFKTDDASFLIDLEKLLKKFLLTQFIQNYPLKESQIIPLLISEPFRRNYEYIQGFIQPLIQLGFLFDQLEPHLFVLRTIPDFCQDLPLNQIMPSLLDHLETNYSKDRMDDTINLIKKWLNAGSIHPSLSIDSLKIMEMFNSFDRTLLLKEKIIIKLDQALFDQLFHGGPNEKA